MSNYNWIDNPTENGVAVCDTDILNECLMHLKYNNQKIKSTLYSFNSGNVNSNGNNELFDFSAPTEVNLTIAETYTINIPTSGYYSVKLVGGGGNGRTALNIYGVNTDSYGGSGAAFVGEVYLNAGTHNLTVGGANGSSILYDESNNALITANGGNNGGSDYNGATNGTGGVLTISSDAQTQNVTVQSNGDIGANGSKYNGYGQGGYGNSNTGRTNGYFSIALPSATDNISYKVGGSYPALTGTLANGEQFTLSGLNSDDITGLADGTYLKYVGSDGSSELLKANLTVAKTVPLNPADNDVWINNSVSPLSVKKYVTPNYTVVGSPTITEDGIASGFTTSDYIKTSSAINLTGATSSVEIIAKIYTGNLPADAIQDIYSTAITNILRLQINNNGLSNVISGVPQASSAFIQQNTNYWIKTTADVINNTVTISSSTDGINYTDRITRSGDITVVNNIMGIGIELGTPMRPFTYGSIDLKEFKIYVDGTLVYQPNITNNGWLDYNKVPLGKITLSSGSITAAKTFPYNIDYVGNNIIETYQNGADWYRVYADGWCEQGGRSLTTGAYTTTTVTLLKKMKDTNYSCQITLFSGSAAFSGNISSEYLEAYDLTTTSFKHIQFANDTIQQMWKVCGYVANN